MSGSSRIILSASAPGTPTRWLSRSMDRHLYLGSSSACFIRTRGVSGLIDGELVPHQTGESWDTHTPYYTTSSQSQPPLRQRSAGVWADSMQQHQLMRTKSRGNAGGTVFPNTFTNGRMSTRFLWRLLSALFMRWLRIPTEALPSVPYVQRPKAARAFDPSRTKVNTLFGAWSLRASSPLSSYCWPIKTSPGPIPLPRIHPPRGKVISRS
jgi:hypothetical protein